MNTKVAAAALALIGLAAAAPARAQLGSSPNPPAQRLFETNTPTRLDTGLGAMAERQGHAPLRGTARRDHRAHWVRRGW